MNPRIVKGLVLAASMIPAVRLAQGALSDRLGANPIETITHTTGDWALRFLLLALAVTPLRRLFRWNGVVPYRRTLGLVSFFYAMLHFSTYVVLDHFFDWQAITEDVAERPYVTAGFTAFVCLLPLAITSTRGWIRRLGRRWAQLHRLAYVAALAAVTHYWWLVKADVRAPFYYAAALALLLGARVVLWRAMPKKKVAARQPRAVRARAAAVSARDDT